MLENRCVFNVNSYNLYKPLHRNSCRINLLYLGIWVENWSHEHSNSWLSWNKTCFRPLDHLQPISLSSGQINLTNRLYFRLHVAGLSMNSENWTFCKIIIVEVNFPRGKLAFLFCNWHDIRFFEQLTAIISFLVDWMSLKKLWKLELKENHKNYGGDFDKYTNKSWTTKIIGFHH